MSICISEAMKLESFKNFKLLSGKNGLYNLIEKIGILDYEYADDNKGKFEKGDFVISSFLFAKNDVNLFYQAVKNLINEGVSGLGIKNIYFKEIPDEIIEYASERSFPIFIFDSICFEDIITEVMNSIRAVDYYERIESKIDMIIKKNISKSLKRELAYELNNLFKENIITAYCRERKHKDNVNIMRLLKISKDTELINEETSFFKYKHGIIIISTCENAADKRNLLITIESIIRNVGITECEYNIGISNYYLSLDELDKAINESLYAVRVSEISKNKTLFKDMGIYKVIVPFLNEIWLKDFCTNIISDLKSYDEKCNTEIFGTAVKYIENQGNIKKTAKNLCQHENTIRYRINKMKEILGMEKLNGDFYEQLSFAIKINNLLKDIL
ncbi:PucR family transcriptional regulator [Clostridium sp. P21]|uniref:PucR family transcriptional regulator n=1 Tax=Clostridium muellerianum TaxID=2716538 RepID=A0A7Y0EIZ6_9CLOT|nr:PucR family transcriptional regulator [Clostridium muellerianum]NMM64002.1 PucR family transcriptional regulator [Clostridium muellerianum]